MNLSEDAVMTVNDDDAVNDDDDAGNDDNAVNNDDDADNMEADAAQEKALEKMKRMKRKESGKKTGQCKVPCHQKRMAKEFFYHTKLVVFFFKSLNIASPDLRPPLFSTSFLPANQRARGICEEHCNHTVDEVCGVINGDYVTYKNMCFLYCDIIYSGWKFVHNGRCKSNEIGLD